MKALILSLLFLVLSACHPTADFEKIDIRIAFGYKDARPARFVGDRYERVAFIQELTEPCAGFETLACGFERSIEDGDLLSKLVLTSTGRRLNVNLRVTASSVSPDDDANRKNPFQKEMSKLSKDNFLEGLNGSNATFYVGHSRDGGGPDFSPPQMTRSKHVNYAAYKKNKTGFKLLLKTMARARHEKKETEVLGLISCASTKLFADKIAAIAPGTRLVTAPQLLYYADSLKMMRKSLSDIISHKLLIAESN